MSNPGKEIEEEATDKGTKTGKNGTRPDERPKEQNCRYCHAPNWNPNHKNSAPESKCHD